MCYLVLGKVSLFAKNDEMEERKMDWKAMKKTVKRLAGMARSAYSFGVFIGTFGSAFLHVFAYSWLRWWAD